MVATLGLIRRLAALYGGRPGFMGLARLTRLVRMLGDEAAREEIGRDLILERLVEILLVEALRAARTQAAQPGLLPMAAMGICRIEDGLKGKRA